MLLNTEWSPCAYRVQPTWVLFPHMNAKIEEANHRFRYLALLEWKGTFNGSETGIISVYGFEKAKPFVAGLGDLVKTSYSSLAFVDEDVDTESGKLSDKKVGLVSGDWLLTGGHDAIVSDDVFFDPVTSHV